jgi:hypothetical protein
MAFALFSRALQSFAARVRGFFGLREGFPQQAAVATVRVMPRPARKPLRVVHSAQGRMVISGRLADVCAELDRLAALESVNFAPTLPCRVAAPRGGVRALGRPCGAQVFAPTR